MDAVIAPKRLITAYRKPQDPGLSLSCNPDGLAVLRRPSASLRKRC